MKSQELWVRLSPWEQRSGIQRLNITVLLGLLPLSLGFLGMSSTFLLWATTYPDDSPICMSSLGFFTWSQNPILKYLWQITTRTFLSSLRLHGFKLEFLNFPSNSLFFPTFTMFVINIILLFIVQARNLRVMLKSSFFFTSHWQSLSLTNFEHPNVL